MKILTCLCASLVAYASAVQAQKWDISAMHGPSEMVRFTVSEGAWMNLDVSPDGESIVFDLLGDLYLLPIKGGEARAPTSGRLRGQSERLLTHRVGHRRQLRVPPLDPEAIQVRNLGNADRQIQFGRDRSQSRRLASHAMGTVFRELVRHFNGSEKAGGHFTPRDTLTALVTLAFQPITRPEAVDPEACRAQADPDYAREHAWISCIYP